MVRTAKKEIRLELHEAALCPKKMSLLQLEKKHQTQPKQETKQNIPTSPKVRTLEDSHISSQQNLHVCD